ncbi:MAG: hypothetical protein KatS3mg131_0070 [Candidatus Tectimicrobiota bacterium]|nr:MAG: hypothetical protein KatS3mg131_0070 [Candidatus Tectomicrobia bacterium]
MQAGACRLAIVASSPADLQKKLAHALQRLADPHCTRIKDRSGIFFFAEPLRRQGSLAFLFPGEGAQYVNMLADLCCHFPEVRTCFDQADQVFLHNGRPLPPSRVVFPPPPLSSTPETAHEGELWQMDYAVATVFTANYALYKLLTALGIRPQAVVGHSSGELTALLAAGALAVDDERQLMEHGLALNALYHTLAEQTPAALLLAVGGAAPEAVAMVVAESKGEIFVAMDNCPHQVVLCGPEAAIVHAQEALQRQGALCRLLPFHRAYHTPLFQPVCEQLVHFFERLRLGPPHIPLYSCATAQPYPAEPAAIGRLAAEQWARPVRFRETIEAMYAAGVRLFVEVGPRGNLTSFVEDILRQRPHLAVPANVAHRSGLVQLHTLLGLLAAHGVEMDLEPLYRRRSPQRLSFTATSPQPASRAAQRIALELPQLRLNPERRTPAAAPVLPAPRLSQPPATGAMPPPNGTAREQGQGRMPVMHGYFQTMARFLQLQQEVMQSFMARQRQASSVSLAALPAAAPNPFSLTVTAGVAGQELVATCVLDPARHLFLRHHTIGGAPSRLDASRVALPVVPLAMMVEIMAQAAALLFPAQRLLACKQVKAYRWMVVEDAPRAFLLQVKRAGHEPVADVTLWETQEGTRPGALLAEGRMVFGTTYPEPPPSAPFSLRAARPYRFSPDQYYREVMFHGPAFRSVRAIARWGEDGIEATVSVPAAEPLFREPAPLLTNPVLLDAAGQAVGFWAADGLAQGFVVFPVGFAELAFYGPPPAGSVPLTCRARTAVLPDRRLRSQIEFVNAEGRVLLRFTDWEDLRFDFPRSLVRFVLSPQDHMLSTPWPAPRQPLPAGVQCCRLDGFPGPLASDALWARAWARLILSRQEYETWNQLGGSAARRQEWLLGRLVAKDAVRLLLRQRYGWSLCPADVELDVDAHGQPRLVGPLAEKVAPPVLISIAHAGGRAAALAVLAEGTRGIGLDIEPLERHPELERLALTAPERAWLEALPADKAKEWVLRLWCAKEAAAKALGCGLAGNPLWFETQAWDEDAGTVTVVLAEPLRQRLPAYLPARLFAYTGRDGNLVFASVLV